MSVEGVVKVGTSGRSKFYFDFKNIVIRSDIEPGVRALPIVEVLTAADVLGDDVLAAVVTKTTGS